MPKQKTRPMDTFGGRYNVPVSDELRLSLAYKILTHTQKLILIDMLRVYCSASWWDTQPVNAEAFCYTYKQCTETVSDKCFHGAVRRICRVGFFDAPLEIQEQAPAAPRRYRPSTDWRRHEPTRDEKRKIYRFEANKKSRITKKKRRRADFRAKLGAPRDETRGKEIRRHDQNKLRRRQENEFPSSRTNYADVHPNIAPFDWNNLRRFIDIPSPLAFNTAFSVQKGPVDPVTNSRCRTTNGQGTKKPSLRRRTGQTN
jgi:hypothetical protein